MTKRLVSEIDGRTISRVDASRILSLVAEEKTDRQIATALGIHHKTVATYRRAAGQKPIWQRFTPVKPAKKSWQMKACHCSCARTKANKLCPTEKSSGSNLRKKRVKSMVQKAIGDLGWNAGFRVFPLDRHEVGHFIDRLISRVFSIKSHVFCAPIPKLTEQAASQKGQP